MKDGLKDSIKDKFDAVELNEEQFAALDKLQGSTAKTSPKQNLKPVISAGWFQFSRIAIAAIFFISLIVGGHSTYRTYNSNMLVDAIVLEAVNNHLNLKPLEIKSTQLEEVLKYFNMLKFNPVKSSAIAGNPGDRLLGGRYCSILGIDAAQIRVLSKDGQISSWYQGMLSPEKLQYIPDIKKGKKPVIRSMKGYQASLWQETGVVFVRVR